MEQRVLNEMFDMINSDKNFISFIQSFRSKKVLEACPEKMHIVTSFFMGAGKGSKAQIQDFYFQEGKAKRQYFLGIKDLKEVLSQNYCRENE